MRRLRPWLPALAWAGLIFYLSSRSTLPVEPRFPYFDKVAHFSAYAILGALLAFATDRSRLPMALAVGLGVLYGASDEVHQVFVPGRSPDVLDWAADAAGVLTACLLYTRWRSRRAAARAAGADASFLRA
ncbi:VanZ family protein [Longimicrobium sp.]|uniref:VanZ family protein n=1 Tax=Longimicrobium sp. TaxID=2029185 RepID=UPI002E2F59DD|nr:VanZ family protein [Longimicrobium sp.]HEX6040629.1 VanZ family protein [Longimicrobium sp.]